MSDTPTPRTNGIRQTIAIGDFMNPGDGLKLALDHADQLEIDLAAANKRIRRLVEAGDEIAFRLRESVFTEDVVAIEEWDHAKL